MTKKSTAVSKPINKNQRPFLKCKQTKKMHCLISLPAIDDDVDGIGSSLLQLEIVYEDDMAVMMPFSTFEVI